MHIITPLKVLFVWMSVGVCLLLVACDQSIKSSWTPDQGSRANSATGETVDVKRYMVADELLGRMQRDNPPLVFDVRARASFAESRVRSALSMPYGLFDETDLAKVDRINKNSLIVTYCGCPHHLAGLAADQLIEMGYTNVRVLHEGYWYWRDNRFPIEGTEQQALTSLQFAGRIVESASKKQSVVFLRNQRNGQLEAAPLDATGRFEVGFHVFGYRPDDRFDILLGDPHSPVLATVSGLVNRVNQIDLVPDHS